MMDCELQDQYFPFYGEISIHVPLNENHITVMAGRLCLCTCESAHF